MKPLSRALFALPPHPATVVQPRRAPCAPQARPPHPATVQRRAAPHAAASFVPSAPLVAQRSEEAPAVERFGGEVSEKVLLELGNMMKGAREHGGKSGGGNQQAQELGAFLEVVMSDKKVPNPGSQGTYGAGAFRIDNSVLLVTVGSLDFDAKMKEVALDKLGKEGALSSLYLGPRDAGVHGEVAIVTDRPGVGAIRTTQDCCMFCYGLVASRDYNHQGLRDQPWPQKWQHDYLGFKLINKAEYLAANANSVALTWAGKTRYYVVTGADE